MCLGINNKYLFSIFLSVKNPSIFLMSCQFWCLFFACRHGLNIKIPIPYYNTLKKNVCIYKATIFAWKELKVHHIIILTIAVLVAIVIKLNIDGWFMMALLCVFRYSKQQHHDQSSSLLQASCKAGFTEDGPWAPCKDKTGWIYTFFVGNSITTIYRTEEVCSILLFGQEH